MAYGAMFLQEPADSGGRRERYSKKNRARGGRSGVTESCASLRTKMDNMSIVRRWGIRIEKYWRGFFCFFSKEQGWEIEIENYWSCSYHRIPLTFPFTLLQLNQTAPICHYLIIRTLISLINLYRSLRTL